MPCDALPPQSNMQFLLVTSILTDFGRKKYNVLFHFITYFIYCHFGVSIMFIWFKNYKNLYSKILSPITLPTSRTLLAPMCHSRNTVCIYSTKLSKIHFYWSIVNLQCCINFYYTAKWYSYISIFFLFIYSFPLWCITI